MDVVWPVATRPPSTDRAAALASLKNEIGTLKNDHVKQALLPLVDAAGDNIEQARKNIASWYNSGMDRISGAYTRNTKWIMLALGFLVAVILNVDTIAIAQRIANDSAVRESLVDISQAYVQANVTCGYSGARSHLDHRSVPTRSDLARMPRNTEPWPTSATELAYWLGSHESTQFPTP